MDDERLFYLAFNFDPVTGEPIIYRPRPLDPEEVHVFDFIYEHFIRCIKEYSYVDAFPPIEISKEIFGEMYYSSEVGDN